MASKKRLTKKKKKAAKHRAYKLKQQGEFPELPESDLEEEVEVGSKKRKAEDAKETREAKKKRKRDADGPRYICFVGQLAYTIKADQLAQHFEASCSERPKVRLLTQKTIDGTLISKGAAFVEFTNSAAMQEGLQLHDSKLGGRKMTVNLTAGGGGKGENRVSKLAKLKERLDAQRAKKKQLSAPLGTGASPDAPAEMSQAPVEVNEEQKAMGKNAKRKEKLAKEGVPLKSKSDKKKRPVKPQLSGANAMKLG